LRRPPSSPLFPYTTLFRSGDDVQFPARASEVAFDDDQAGVFQERRRQVLAPAAQGLSAQASSCACVPRRSSLSHVGQMTTAGVRDRKSTRLNSSHVSISYA